MLSTTTLPKLKQFFQNRWRTYSLAVFAFITVLWLIDPQGFQRTAAATLADLKGGRPGSLLLAYIGSFLLVAAIIYTFVKRVGEPTYMVKLGGPKLWLRLHTEFSFAGFIAIMIHAGLPFAFNYAALFKAGFAVLTMWLLMVSSVSGLFGRYLYVRLPVMRREFRYWKQFHVILTVLLFFFAIAHMTTVIGGD